MNQTDSSPFDRAHALFAVRQYERALSYIDEQLAREPDNVHALLLQSLCHRLLGNPAATRRSAEEALRRDPGCHLALYQISVIQRDYEYKFNDARETIRQALRLAPDDPNYHAHHGFCELALQRHEEALAAAQKALSLDPSHLNGRLCRIQALMELQRNAEASKEIEAALAMKPEEGRVHLMKSLSLLEAGDADAAERCLRDAQQLAASSATDFERRFEQVGSRVRERALVAFLAPPALLAAGFYLFYQLNKDSEAEGIMWGLAILIVVAVLLLYPKDEDNPS